MRNSVLLAAGALIASVSGAAQAYVTAHVETSSVQQASMNAGAYFENFSGAQGLSTIADFGGSGVKATVTGVSVNGASGTAGFGSTPHATVTDHATMKLDRMVKYFGYRTAELDGNSTVELFSNGKSLGFYNLVGTPELAGVGVVGQAMGSAIGRMGVKHAPGFTYVNFFSDQGFDEVRFTQRGGSLKLDDMSINNINAVPEPATWGLMMMGFGVAGAALRRRVKGVRFA